MTVPLWRCSAADLAKAVRKREVSSQQVVEAHLDRITVINPKVNALTLVLAEDALRAAGQADRQIASGEAVGPLHGIPITLKLTFDLAGTATTLGLVELKDKMPDVDAPVVRHLKQAGAIPIGRTNVPEFGLRWHTDNELHGATLNPWDQTRTPGGSSGGEAAAIATGMSVLGIGGDMGGSLRFPAQCCGIASIKPSLGRVSRVFTAIFPDPPMLYEQIACVTGPMARHISDLRLALDVMSAPDPGDPCWVPAPRLGAAVPRPISVAVTTDPGGHGSCPIVAKAVLQAADILADAGYVVEEIEPPGLARSTEIIQQIADTEMTHYLPGMLPMMSKEGQSYLQTLVADTVCDLPTYMSAIAERHRIARDWSLFMQRYPLILGPVSTMQPFKTGYDVAGPGELKRFIQSIKLTEICNLLGLPGIAVPVGVDDGLPQGVQLVGPRFHEDLCFDAAEIIEQHCGVLTPVDPAMSR